MKQLILLFMLSATILAVDVEEVSSDEKQQDPEDDNEGKYFGYPGYYPGGGFPGHGGYPGGFPGGGYPHYPGAGYPGGGYPGGGFPGGGFPGGGYPGGGYPGGGYPPYGPPLGPYGPIRPPGGGGYYPGYGPYGGINAGLYGGLGLGGFGGGYFDRRNPAQAQQGQAPMAGPPPGAGDQERILRKRTL